ncbi:hypothetical protein [Bradyrhizobium erythrophlei]|uniref:Uncharacterized protein n=1 Tax=Bradyrhizobium erythrophlei TaxID=1437360 RepID=A0A1M7UW17_9BRAD|nr:hypothetical protein [Bradyrhizobium erythrophlei]SHN87172.1 hypothetical protein SAMN05444170_7042 [Bradyrhizobium erythrophlei]
MDAYHRLKQGSPLHTVMINSEDTFSIMAVDQDSEDSVRRFQRVALDALERNDGSYEVVHDHKSTGFSVGLYDIIVIKKA